MASFKIHEDNCVELGNGKICGAENNKENKSRIPKKVVAVAEKRTALQCFNNGAAKQAAKKFKTCDAPEMNVKEQIQKKEEKHKPIIDTHLFGEDSEEKIATKHCEEAADSISLKSLKFGDDYSEDIWNYYKETECSCLPKPNYMDKQPHITWNMRSILVDWLVCVADEYEMSEESLHLAVNYVDRFLSKISVLREKLQLVGAASMLISGKMEEIYPPLPKEWAYLTGDTYTTRQIRKMEQLVIKILKFELQPPTSYSFIRKLSTDLAIDEVTTHLAMYISELVLLEGDHYLHFQPSEIAAACILSARYNLIEPDVWPRDLENRSGYTKNHLSPIVKAQSVTLSNSPHKKQQAIQEKYKDPKFGRVALLKPRKIDDFFGEEGEAKELDIGGGDVVQLKEIEVNNNND